MTAKKIGNLERVLISECVKPIPDFGKITRLFEMGADINAVNEFGECTAAIVFEGYCSLYGAKLRSGFFAPQLVACFIDNGFDVCRHGLKTVSELQNGCYDKYMRMAVKMILDRRRKLFKKEFYTLKLCTARLCRKLTRPKVA